MTMSVRLIGDIIIKVQLMRTYPNANHIAPKIPPVEHLNGQRSTVVGGGLANAKMSRMQRWATQSS